VIHNKNTDIREQKNWQTEMLFIKSNLELQVFFDIFKIKLKRQKTGKRRQARGIRKCGMQIAECGMDKKATGNE
jgi:hypothetical protein